MYNNPTTFSFFVWFALFLFLSHSQLLGLSFYKAKFGRTWTCVVSQWKFTGAGLLYFLSIVCIQSFQSMYKVETISTYSNVGFINLQSPNRSKVCFDFLDVHAVDANCYSSFAMLARCGLGDCCAPCIRLVSKTDHPRGSNVWKDNGVAQCSCLSGYIEI